MSSVSHLPPLLLTHYAPASPALLTASCLPEVPPDLELVLHQGALWAYAHNSPSLFNACQAAATLGTRPIFRSLGLSSDVGPVTGVPWKGSLSFHHVCLKTGSPGQLWGDSSFFLHRACP